MQHISGRGEVGNLREEDTLEDPGINEKTGIKIDLQDVVGGGGGGGPHDGDRWLAEGNEPSVYTKCRTFLD
jgi:hypothetical protein